MSSTLGTVIAELRRQRGLSQAELARQVDLSQVHVARIERGTIKRPHSDTLQRLAAALGTPVARLLGTIGAQSAQIPGAPTSRVLGATIAALRRQRGLSQAALAQQAGLSALHIAKIERGFVQGPRRDTLQRLATALGISVADLLLLREEAATPELPPDGVAGRALGPTIAALRRRRGLSQAELAQQTGVSRSTVAMIEAGAVKRPGADTLRHLATVLGISVADLLLLRAGCSMRKRNGAKTQRSAS